MADAPDAQPVDFIREIINRDITSGKYGGRVHTRFPPEPNGYLHIGHAKSICLNFGIAEEYGGKCNLRFDDTNPAKEEDRYVKSIIEDVKWLGFDWDDRLFYASDYFEQMYEYAVRLIKDGYAYVDDQSAEEISRNRGTLTEPGRNSPFRNRTVEENLELFRRMRDGFFSDGEKVLRAKIDMAHPNMNMRDPVMYRILKVKHHNTGDKWCIYPTYDWAHGLEDSIEGITHSICTLEFENHRPLYDWFLDKLGIYHPQQIEFARLNLTYTVMSKRMLLELVEGKYVSGWDDPRLPTISGMRRRGYPPEAIKTFCKRIGVSKVNSIVDFEFLEHCVREELNKTAPRRMGVLNPIKIVIENIPEGETVEIVAMNNPEDMNSGTRKLRLTREIFIERDDFMESPIHGFHRLSPKTDVRLRYAYILSFKNVVKDHGQIVELRCMLDKNPDRRVKSTIHWVSVQDSINAEVRLYDNLFTVKEPAGEKGVDFKTFINPNSLVIVQNCKVEPSVADFPHFLRFQFERLGYFCVDPDTSREHNRLVLNRTVKLKDSWSNKNILKPQQN